MNLKIKEENAAAAYAKADTAGKALIQNLWPDHDFAPKNIMDRVKTFEDACAVLGRKAENIITGSDSTDEAAYKRLKVIAEALNEGWKPDWENEDEYKYYPWWKMQGGFSLNYVDHSWTVSDVGSRLCFKSRELAEYAAAQFLSVYKEYFTI